MMKNYLIVNFDRKEYLQSAEFGEESSFEAIASSYDGILTALAVLLCNGNNRGGGDLRSDHCIIGQWAGNRIALVDDKVCDPELSEPGLAHIPLAEQARTRYVNVSSVVIDAIVDGEGAYTVLSQLSDYLKLHKTVQRSLPGEGLAFYSRENFDKKSFTSLEHLFNVFGQCPGYTAKTSAPRLEKGLEFFAELHDRPERYAVKSLEFVKGLKSFKRPYLGRDESREGVVRVLAKLEEKSSGKAVSLEVNLPATTAKKGSTFKDVLEQVFPGCDLFKTALLEHAASNALVENLLAQIKR